MKAHWRVCDHSPLPFPFMLHSLNQGCWIALTEVCSRTKHHRAVSSTLQPLEPSKVTNLGQELQASSVMPVFLSFFFFKLTYRWFTPFQVTANWLTYTFFFFRFFSIICYYKIFEYSYLCYIEGPCWACISSWGSTAIWLRTKGCEYQLWFWPWVRI